MGKHTLNNAEKAARNDYYAKGTTISFLLALLLFGLSQKTSFFNEESLLSSIYMIGVIGLWIIFWAFGKGKRWPLTDSVTFGGEKKEEKVNPFLINLASLMLCLLLAILMTHLF